MTLAKEYINWLESISSWPTVSCKQSPHWHWLLGYRCRLADLRKDGTCWEARKLQEVPWTSCGVQFPISLDAYFRFQIEQRSAGLRLTKLKTIQFSHVISFTYFPPLFPTSFAVLEVRVQIVLWPKDGGNFRYCSLQSAAEQGASWPWMRVLPSCKGRDGCGHVESPSMFKATCYTDGWSF